MLCLSSQKHPTQKFTASHHLQASRPSPASASNEQWPLVHRYRHGSTTLMGHHRHPDWCRLRWRREKECHSCVTPCSMGRNLKHFGAIDFVKNLCPDISITLTDTIMRIPVS
ncbi:AAEL001012-PA [Aedes aegypti]|nr:AAEL001012-PA [Aedes aegypti]